MEIYLGKVGDIYQVTFYRTGFLQNLFSKIKCIST
jgi:hypothetical protein